MKITITTGSLFWAAHLARGLRSDGHECTLLLAGRHRCMDGIPLRSLPMIDLVGRSLSRLLPRHQSAVRAFVCRIYDRWAAAQVRRLAPDLVIGWSSWSRETFARAAASGAARALERGSTHIAVQDELLEAECVRWGVSGEYVDRRIRCREEAEYELANWITVPSTFASGSFLQHGMAADRLEVVPFGVDTDLFRPAGRRGRCFQVLFVGLIGVRKGIPYLLDAYARVHRDDTGLLLVGPLSSKMKAVLRATGVAYHHLGTQSPATVASLMGMASVLVVPSIEEGLARVILEGMASGIPVIATMNTGAADVMTDGVEGFIVPPRNVDALAECLAFLRDHPGVACEMGMRGRQRVEHAFTWEHYYKRAADVVTRRTRSVRHTGTAASSA